MVISCTVPACFKNDKKVQYAYYIFKDRQSEPVKKILYSVSSFTQYKVEEPSMYRARVYVRKDGNWKRKVLIINFREGVPNWNRE
ncbi:hypothetical protein COJ77_18300 [Bacillus cereus]|nr:hypothetical protein COJ77_18300 [Bacillus cereus]